jgi:hypothetical protein
MTRRALPVLSLIALAFTAVIVQAKGVPTPSGEAYPMPTLISEAGIRIDPPRASDAAGISQTDAVNRAAIQAGGLADTRNPFSAQLVRLTDLNYKDPNGALMISDRLVWLIRFTGTPQPVYGGVDPVTGEAQASGVTPATELNAVIDATTGVWLESFSFR